MGFRKVFLSKIKQIILKNYTKIKIMTTSTTTIDKQDKIPTWIFWYGVIVMVGAPLIFGVMTIMGPDIGTKTLSDGSTIDTGLFKYGIRNIAAAAVTIFALYKRSAAMLLVIFIMRFITEAGDLLDAYLFSGMDSTSLLSYAAMMVFIAFVPYSLGIHKLWPMVR